MNERRLIAQWLLLCSMLVGGFALVGIAWGGADRIIFAIDRRWLGELERAEALVAGGDDAAAVALLGRLDRTCPVVWVKHRHDRDRERLFELLGGCQLRLGRKRDALVTFARLVAFDPRNWRNHFLLAEAHRELLDLEAADEAYAAVLRLHPSHLPSIERRVELRWEDGRYDEIPPLFESYLDAWYLAPMRLRLGSTEVSVEVPADGRERTVEAVADVEAHWGGELALDTGGFSVRLSDVVLLEPLRIGVPGPPAATRLDGPRDWDGEHAERSPDGVWVALDGTSSLRREVPDHAVARVRWRLQVFKPVPPVLWARIEASYENSLDFEGLAAARTRSTPGGYPDAASRFDDSHYEAPPLDAP